MNEKPEALADRLDDERMNLIERLADENERLREEVRNWKKSFVGHVYVKNEDYAELISKRDALKTENERLHDELRQSSIDITRAEVERLKAENERLRDGLACDWAELKACRASLREHLLKIERLREALQDIARQPEGDEDSAQAVAKAALRREGT